MSISKVRKIFSAINNSRQSFVKENIFCVAVKELIIKSLMENHDDFTDEQNFNFLITNTKIEFKLFHAQPFSGQEFVTLFQH